MTKKTYATCDCGREMVPNGGCTLTHIQTPQGKYMERLRNGHEGRFGGGLEDKMCHDCNAGVGQYHHIGCDWEECPVCCGQALGCEHIQSFVEFEEKKS